MFGIMTGFIERLELVKYFKPLDILFFSPTQSHRDVVAQGNKETHIVPVMNICSLRDHMAHNAGTYGFVSYLRGVGGQSIKKEQRVW